MRRRNKIRQRMRGKTLKGRQSISNLLARELTCLPAGRAREASVSKRRPPVKQCKGASAANCEIATLEMAAHSFAANYGIYRTQLFVILGRLLYCAVYRTTAIYTPATTPTMLPAGQYYIVGKRRKRVLRLNLLFCFGTRGLAHFSFFTLQTRSEHLLRLYLS